MDWSQLVIDIVMVLSGCLGTLFLAYGLSDWAERSGALPDDETAQADVHDAFSEVVNM
jgi:hypothetical protein